MDGTTQTEVASSTASTQTSTQTSTPATDATNPSPEAGLFGDDLISSDVVAALPSGYKLRALRQSDYHAGFLECLRVLTTVGDITEAQFADRFEWIRKQDGSYYVLVIEDAGRVVGTGALIAERKFIHDLGMVGHIEDIAVAKDQQGKKLGLRLIQALDFIANKIGCYKTILDCSDANEGFYIKCGFKRAGLEMAHYHNK
ncbi:Glucosamine-phosphate N-acetyltransferase-like protein [Gnomoniopsis smithogilvyi]|uniref:Glucosamine 6-phosphate N-acetyltransferase n=1 Tax=Gnomoniopsis smithogilvyi TaxID=1191159 RepID=A0A9W8YK52_9PEZI|nr:Glucosamine-phosphate N-acetyltransferase-like protein [Gnomoniopsis smithogilvyi]